MTAPLHAARDSWWNGRLRPANEQCNPWHMGTWTVSLRSLPADSQVRGREGRERHTEKERAHTHTQKERETDGQRQREGGGGGGGTRISTRVWESRGEDRGGGCKKNQRRVCVWERERARERGRQVGRQADIKTGRTATSVPVRWETTLCWSRRLRPRGHSGMHHALSCLLHASMRYDVFIFAPPPSSQPLPLLPKPFTAVHRYVICATLKWKPRQNSLPCRWTEQLGRVNTLQIVVM